MSNPADEAIKAAKDRVRQYLAELKPRVGLDQEVISNLRPPLDGKPGIELRVDDLELVLEFADLFSAEALETMSSNYQKSIDRQKKSVNRLQAIIEFVARTAADRTVDPVTRLQRIQSKLG